MTREGAETKLKRIYNEGFWTSMGAEMIVPVTIAKTIGGDI